MHLPVISVLPLCYHMVVAIRKKRSISMPPELDAEIAAAAAEAGLSYSAWLASAARKEFTVRAGLAAVSQYEHEHGAFSADEIAGAHDLIVSPDEPDLQQIAAAAGSRLEIDPP